MDPVPAQQRIRDFTALTQNAGTLILREQYRMRAEFFRLKMARERILKDGFVTPAEKRKLKRLKNHMEKRKKRKYPHR